MDKVDTIIIDKIVSPGSNVNYKINIYCGEVSPYIDKVILKINTNYKKEVDKLDINVDTTIQEFVVKVDKTVNPNENITIPFSFRLDYNCPISKCNSRIFLKLDLILKMQ